MTYPEIATMATSELERHASVSRNNQHYCSSCFCCASLDEVRRRRAQERARLARLRADKRARREPLTAHERHEMATDHGVDTWEEMRGEK